uniref:RING-type domain-containing protein n=1 Tax=Macrostomum lignano TaxID=282301 RepID=A0A1I8IL26_9PLAT
MCEHEDLEFAQPVPDRLKCPVCLGHLRSALQTCCGHRFCHSCFYSATAGGGPGPYRPTCPLCRSPIGEGAHANPAAVQGAGVFSDLATDREVQQLLVHCPRCRTHCELGTLAAHLAAHLTASDDSSTDGAAANAEKSAAAAAAAACQCAEASASVACPFCQHSTAYRQLNFHLLFGCPAFPLPCPNRCGLVLAGPQRLQDHLEKACPLSLLLCPFNKFGCPAASRLRRELSRHVAEAHNYHLQLLWQQMYPVQLVQQPDKLLLVNFTGRDGRWHQWPVKEQRVLVRGDIYLGGLMMVHSRSESRVCGSVMPQGGVQALEAMLFTLDQVNRLGLAGPNVTLGAFIKDDCDRDTYGLDQAVEFIKASPKISSGQAACSRRPSFDAGVGGEGDGPPLITGVVGAPSSITSSHVASLLKLFDIPQISFFSTAPQLSDKNRFPFFMKTIPSDAYQAVAIVELAKLFNWSYVSVVYEDSSYGRGALEQMERLFRESDICLARVETLPRDSKLARVEDYYDKIERLLNHQSLFDGLGAKGVIIFGSDQEVGDFMSAVRRLNCSDKFSWIGSDGWGARPLAYRDGNEKTVEGAVTVQPLAEPIVGFKEYFLSLRPDTNKRNPWFAEFWEDYFDCWLPDGPQTPYNQKHSEMCRPELRMSESDAKFVLEPQLQFVSDAVMAFAVALRVRWAALSKRGWLQSLSVSENHSHAKLPCKIFPQNLRIQLCRPGVSHPACLHRLATSGSELLVELKSVNFTGLSGMDVHFTPGNADGPPRYRILNFQADSESGYSWREVGRFDGARGGVQLEWSSLRFRGGASQPPVSACRPECSDSSIRQVSPGECSCWMCVHCPDYHVVDEERQHCILCKKGTRPSSDRTTCEPIDMEFLSFGHPVAAVAATLASLGVAASLFVLFEFARYRDSAVVQASGLELSLLLLLGLVVCYSATFLLCARPSNWLCGVQRFVVGFGVAVSSSALLVKTVRLERRFRTGRPGFEPLKQVLLFLLLVAVQLAALIGWLLLQPPKSVSHFPSRDRHQLVCSSLIGLLYLVGLAYPMLLVLLCTVCAFFARNIPDGFNETKHIGFTMYSSCVIWLGFVPCYALTGAFVHIRVATLCFAITLSATVTLACLFGPKLYIILLRPELNVRQAEQCGCQYPLQERQPEPEAKRLLSSQLQIDDCSQT